jgi:hypothetical protein
MDHRSRVVNQDRHRLTAAILNSLDPEQRLSLPVATQCWWSNTMPNGGFRLTAEGYAILSQYLAHPGWCFPVSREQLNTRMLLDLDQKVACPFYIDHRRGEIFLFGSSEAMMVKLHGDISRWIRLLPKRPNK